VRSTGGAEDADSDHEFALVIDETPQHMTPTAKQSRSASTDERKKAASKRKRESESGAEVSFIRLLPSSEHCLSALKLILFFKLFMLFPVSQICSVICDGHFYSVIWARHRFHVCGGSTQGRFCYPQ
jgi:hypothetical protein